MTKPELTYCILHYNKLDKLKNTIRHIEKNTPIPYQVYIWNNGFIDREIVKYFKRLENKPEYRIIYCDKNLGISLGRNMLLKLVDTKYMFVVDDDMYISDNTINVALNIFKKYNIGAISFPQYDSKMYLLSTSGLKIKIKNNIIYKYKIPLQECGFIYCDGVPAGAMFFKRELKKYFEYDPNYKVGFDDLDKTLQIYFSNCPYRQVVSFDSFLVHDQVKYKDKADYLKIRRDYKELRRSYTYFMRKWGLRLPLIDHILYKYIYALSSREIVMMLNYGIRKMFRVTF